MKRLLIFLYEFVPVLSLIIAIVAIFQSNRALRLSEEANEISNNMNVIALEANQIALESNQSNVKISYLYPFGDYRDYYKEPCISSNGFVSWSLEYAPVLDITNTGGRAVSLTGINFERKVKTKDNRINAIAFFDFFSSSSDFIQWFTARDFSPISSRIKQSLESSIFNGPPIKIESGETKRILLHGIVEVTIDPQISIQQVFELHGYPFWENQITFIFGDGTQNEVTVYVPGPFDGVPGASDDYKACPNP